VELEIDKFAETVAVAIGEAKEAETEEAKRGRDARESRVRG